MNSETKSINKTSNTAKRLGFIREPNRSSRDEELSKRDIE